MNVKRTNEKVWCVFVVVSFFLREDLGEFRCVSLYLSSYGPILRIKQEEDHHTTRVFVRAIVFGSKVCEPLLA